MLNKAILLAVTHHTNQKDKAGEPYILHPLTLMVDMDTNEERIVAVLHDILEDTNVSINILRENFPEYIVDAIFTLTKKVGESNIEYYNRIKQNPLALKVKFADILHNLDKERVIKLPKEIKLRLEKKYYKALKYLLME